MKENLAVMNERQLFPPVILGGAALTRRYVEEDLRSMYGGTVFYANDAFDGLHFMQEIVTNGKAAVAGVRPAAKPPVATAGGNGDDDDGGSLSGLEAKIALAPKDEGRQESRAVAGASIPSPPFFGSKVVEEIPVDDVYAFINEVALIRGQWQVRKQKLSDAAYETMLKEKVLPDLVRLKREAREQKLLAPKVVYGYFPCQSDGNDLIIYRPENLDDPVSVWNIQLPGPAGLTEWVRFSFPRQSKGKLVSIADYFAPRNSGRMDVVAFHLVTMGSVASEHTRRLFAENNYKEYLYFHGLSVECAEALAELWHATIRKELGIGGGDARELKKLFHQQYQGSRYSFGYPACPRLEDQQQLFDLLRPERIGVSLTEEFQLVPEQSTSAIIVHHPEAKYFNI
jgi:5-methyltetrahydrofolate--homocysteine methyltransferase